MSWKQKGKKIFYYGIYPLAILNGILIGYDYSIWAGIFFICLALIGLMDKHELNILKKSLEDKSI